MAKRSWAAIAGVVCLWGCAAVSGGAETVLKSPVSNRCEKAGLDGCPDIVTGALAYAQGDAAAGEDALRRGVAANMDKAAELERFAVALELIGKVPGAGQYVQPLQPAILLIKEAADQAAATPSAPAPAAAVAAATAPATAPATATATARPTTAGTVPVPTSGVAAIDLDAVETESLVASSPALTSRFMLVGATRTECPRVFPETAQCVSKGFPRSTRVTTVIVSPACPNDVILSAGAPRMSQSWLLWVPPGRGLDLRDVELPLTRYEAITLGVVGSETEPDPRCGVNVVAR